MGNFRPREVKVKCSLWPRPGIPQTPQNTKARTFNEKCLLFLYDQSGHHIHPIRYSSDTSKIEDRHLSLLGEGVGVKLQPRIGSSTSFQRFAGQLSLLEEDVTRSWGPCP